jgi:hypothetical protein
MGGKYHVELVSPQADRLRQIRRPPARIADNGAADREDVVLDVGGVLRGAQRAGSGNQMCIGAGGSVSGVSWNTIRTPSMVSCRPVAVISTVGAISVASPAEVVCPRPVPIKPAGRLGTDEPYM